MSEKKTYLIEQEIAFINAVKERTSGTYPLVASDVGEVKIELNFERSEMKILAHGCCRTMSIRSGGDVRKVEGDADFKNLALFFSLSMCISAFTSRSGDTLVMNSPGPFGETIEIDGCASSFFYPRVLSKVNASDFAEKMNEIRVLPFLKSFEDNGCKWEFSAESGSTPPYVKFHYGNNVKVRVLDVTCPFSGGNNKTRYLFVRIGGPLRYVSYYSSTSGPESETFRKFVTCVSIGRRACIRGPGIAVFYNPTNDFGVHGTLSIIPKDQATHPATQFVMLNVARDFSLP